MRNLTLLVLLQFAVLPAFAADTPKPCTFCAGVVVTPDTPPSAEVPSLVELQEADLTAAGTALDAWTPEQRKHAAVIVSYSVTSTDAVTDIEQHTRTIVDWAHSHGPFDAIGVNVSGAPDASAAAYAIKRLSVEAQGLGVASRIILPDSPGLAAAFESGAGSYFDDLLVNAGDVQKMAAWLAEHDPSKKISARVAPAAPDALFDVARAFADGATRAYATGPIDATALAQLNRTFTGDWAFDSTSKTPVLDAKGNAIDMPVLAFVRGEDLRTLLFPRGDATAPSILSLTADAYSHPHRVDAAGEREITDTGRKGNRFLIGTPATSRPYAIALEHVEKPVAGLTKETINIATQRGISVEEIIRNHQAYDAWQRTVQPRYIALDTTKLRFDLAGGEALEAAISGDYFADPHGQADWVWKDFYINGVRWKYGKIPELPLVQPEKVTQLPLDIHLTNDYRYELVRETDLRGFHTYEVRFAPPQNAPADLPLYRGTVWIDAKTWARVRISMIQLHLTGEVLSNEERVDFAAFTRDTKQELTPAEIAKSDPRNLVWLPYDIAAQQVVSAAGRASAVQRATTFTHFRLDPEDYAARLAEASASDARMVRDTAAGLRYLEKSGSGERVVKEGFDTSRLFMLGGVHHDAGLQYPVVPLGGVDYFNFDLAHRGIQTNVFFAGVILAANATDPNVGNTRTNVGADFFGIAVPVENTIYRNGEERKDEGVRSLPLSLTLRAGHPVLQFGKIDLSVTASHYNYSRGQDASPSFAVPPNTFVIGPSISAQYARRGWAVSSYYDWNTRTSWHAWGDPAEYNDDQKTFTHYGASISKSLFLPKFQRVTLDLNYLDGSRLDRFSKYELGFFGSQRVHGVRSGSVRAERAIIAHLSYGFVFSDQFRLEGFYDHALVDDAAAGLRRAPFQGVGIAGQTIGPWGTLLRLDIGKTIGRNAQDGFVANVVFLKLF